MSNLPIIIIIIINERRIFIRTNHYGFPFVQEQAEVCRFVLCTPAANRVRYGTHDTLDNFPKGHGHAGHPEASFFRVSHDLFRLNHGEPRFTLIFRQPHFKGKATDPH